MGIPPEFLCMAILLIFLLVKGFSWLPPLDYVSLWNDPGTNLRQMALPALALSFAVMVPIGRVARLMMMEALGEDYIRRTGVNGPRLRAAEYRHAMKKALLPVVITGGYEFGRLFVGAMVIEVLFYVPGMGRLLWESVLRRDFPMVQGPIIVAVVVVMVWNLALDVAHAWVNPRVRGPSTRVHPPREEGLGEAIGNTITESLRWVRRKQDV